MSAILQSLERLSHEAADSTALVSAGVCISYADLHKRVTQLAEKLSAYTGQRAAIDIQNGIDWVVTDLACIRCNIISVPLPPFFTDTQKQHAIDSTGTTLLFSDEGSASASHIDGTVYIETCKPGANTVSLPPGTSKVTFTSGTTGQPKGVCLSQAGMEAVAISLLEAIGRAPAKRTAAILPLGVLLENIAGCYATLMAGGCYDVQPQQAIGFTKGMLPDFARLLAYLEESQASSCILVPELLRGLLQVVAATAARLPAMTFMAVGGAHVSPMLLMQAAKLGLPVFQGYGLSEAASVVCLNTTSDLASVGNVLPHTRVSVSDEGEIVLHQPALLGYVGGGIHTGPFYTGDLGRLDEKGNLYITGRKKNVIINSMGRNISPEWPESELLTRPEIAQAMVYDGGHNGLSAFLVPASAEVSPKQLAEAVNAINQAMPEYARIVEWQVSAPFSISNNHLTGTGRPRRDAILADIGAQPVTDRVEEKM